LKYKIILLKAIRIIFVDLKQSNLIN